MEQATVPRTPEQIFRAKNARVLAEAGIQHQGYPLGQAGGVPGVGGAMAQPTPPQRTPTPTATPFADDYSDPLLGSSGVSTGVSPTLPPGTDLLLSSMGTVTCPECGHKQPGTHKKCSECGADLNLSAAQEPQPAGLLLAELSADERNKLSESDFVFPKERRYPIPDESHAKNALARSSGKPEEAAVKAAVYKKYPSLKPDDKKQLSQEGEEHAVTIFDSLQLAEKRDDGLVWKAICKTGELALSPGPGQIDVEKPLVLTRELFDELVLSVEEQAFPYVTIPVSHANGLLENTGYVRALSIEPSTDPRDPEGTDVLWAGMDFTEPAIAERVHRGTIPDTSVGVKFGYRNKRTGKLYAAALEHVALTHQPWVDGLIPFGAGLSQDGVFNIEDTEPEWDGVFTRQAVSEPSPEDILSSEGEPGGITASLPPEPTPMKHTRKTTFPASAAARHAAALAAAARTTPEIPDTVEELLASQQVQIEAERQRSAELELRLAAQEGRTASQAEAMHLANVQAKVKQWEKAFLPPAWIKEARDILLAAGPQPAELDEDNAVLTLSITPEPKEEGETPQPVEQHLSVQGIIDRLALSVPKFAPGTPVTEVMAGLDELHASQRDGNEKSAADRAKEILEQAEKSPAAVV